MSETGSPQAHEDAAGEPCPTPLAWHNIREVFLGESTEWTIPVAEGEIVGRSFGEGPPLYLLGGLTSGPEMFCLIAWLLRDEFTCLIYEPPDSALAPRDHDHSRVLRTVAGEMGHDKLSLLACGAGSMTALHAMQQVPECVAGVVFLGGFARCRLSWAERLAIRVGGLVPGSIGSLPLFGRIQEYNHRRWFPPFDATRWEFCREQISEHRIRRVCRAASALRRFDMRDALPSLQTPALVVTAEGEGPIRARAADELAQGLPQAQVEELNNTGQFPHVTHPHRLVKVLRQFLTPLCVEATQGTDASPAHVP